MLSKGNYRADSIHFLSKSQPCLSSGIRPRAPERSEASGQHIEEPGSRDESLYLQRVSQPCSALSQAAELRALGGC